MGAKVDEHVSRTNGRLGAAHVAVGKRGDAQLEGRVLCVSQVVDCKARAAARRIRQPREHLKERIRAMVDGEVVRGRHVTLITSPLARPYEAIRRLFSASYPRDDNHSMPKTARFPSHASTIDLMFEIEPALYKHCCCCCFYLQPHSYNTN